MTVRQARQLQRIRADGKAVTPGFFDRAWDLLRTTLDESQREYRDLRNGIRGDGLIGSFNYADLRETVADAGDVANCYGRVTPHDGGEDQFIWRVGVATDDGGRIISSTATQAAGGYWERAGDINVKQFGAVGSGAVSEWVAFAAADASAVAAGRPLHIPTGSYLIDALFAGNAREWVFEAGAKIVVAGGVTCSIAGAISAHPLQQIFDGSGTVTLGTHYNVSPCWWGVVGDGTDAVVGTDNTTALFRMRRTLMLAVVMWVLTFPPGRMYDYKRPYWLRTIRRLHVIAYGARFRNVETNVGGTFDMDRKAMATNLGQFQGPYAADGVEFPLGANEYGSLIATIAVGSLTVTCLTPADAAYFQVGDQAQLYGQCIQDDSFPPNPRRFEIVEVESSNAGTGVITFTTPIRESYRQDWHDFNPGKGAARILNLSRNATSGSDWAIGEELIWEGGEMVAFPGAGLSASNEGQFFLAGYKKATIKDLITPTSGVSVCDNVEVRNSKLGYCVLDKVINDIVLRQNTYKALTEGTGINRLVVDGGEIDGEPAIGANHQAWLNVSVRNDLSTFGALNLGGGWPVSSILIRGLRVNEQPLNDDASWVVGASDETLTVASVPANNKILITAVGDAGAEPLCRAIDLGFVLRRVNAAPTAGDVTAVGIVTAIYREDVNNMAIEADFSVIPVAGDVWTWSTVQHQDGPDDSSVAIGGGRRISSTDCKAQRGPHAKRRARVGPPIVYGLKDLESGIGTGLSPATNTAFRAMGRIKSIWVDVQKAYTGASANCFLVLRHLSLARALIQNLYQFDLTVVGVREITRSATVGAAGNDGYWNAAGAYVGLGLPAIRAETYQDLGLSLYHGGGFYPAYVDFTQLPQFVISIELYSDN